jgi:hypothetical protein
MAPLIGVILKFRKTMLEEFVLALLIRVIFPYGLG